MKKPSRDNVPSCMLGEIRHRDFFGWGDKARDEKDRWFMGFGVGGRWGRDRVRKRYVERNRDRDRERGAEGDREVERDKQRERHKERKRGQIERNKRGRGWWGNQNKQLVKKIDK